MDGLLQQQNHGCCDDQLNPGRLPRIAKARSNPVWTRAVNRPAICDTSMLVSGRTEPTRMTSSQRLDGVLFDYDIYSRSAADDEPRRRLPRLTAKDPCAPCGLCCRSYLVPLFGHDLWQIVTERNLTPDSFVFVAEQETPDALGFRLMATGPTHGLALLKQEPMVASQPCIFLESSANGHTRCGIYDHRPITCRAYPMSKLGSQVYQRPNTLCPPDAWAPEDLVATRWWATLQRLRMDRDIYVEVVARWNAAVLRWQPPGMLPPAMFCDFVLAVYARIGVAVASIEPSSMAALIDSWATVAPRPPQTADEIAVGRKEEPGWISHLRQIRAIIDQFFPELPPLPFQSLVVEPIGGQG